MKKECVLHGLASAIMPLNAVVAAQILGADDGNSNLVAAAPNGSLYDTVAGKASYTGGNLAGGKCMLSTYQLPAGLFGTALSARVWDASYHCGECVEVSNAKGKTVTVMVVDVCTPCEATRLNLFQPAFAELADPSRGVIDATWTYVPCGFRNTPLRLRNKAGASAWWFSMQVVGADVPVASLEVSVDGGRTWRPTRRQEYNFFEEPAGFGSDTVSVRVTGETGGSVVVHGVGVESELEVTAGGECLRWEGGWFSFN
ncbi:carbohydrate-binding module family 63 protein [Apiospora kogelbergensis]|uniref:Carbohydrate-binding module family 63 protein n=1 Tax=Apiospora kogelbergensis TaxID=1337665 RepID=A0AAW0R2F5_9PEZI